MRLNFDTDWEFAKETMLQAARDATADVIAETGVEPTVRVEFLDWGLLARLRFQCLPTEREKMATQIIEVLLREFRSHYPRIRFAVPHSRVNYELETPGGAPQAVGTGPTATGPAST